MVAAPLVLEGGLKIWDQNNWGDLNKKLNLEGELNFRGRGAGGGGTSMNPNDAMVVVLKDILLCLLGFRFIYIVYISWYYI